EAAAEFSVDRSPGYASFALTELQSMQMRRFRRGKTKPEAFDVVLQQYDPQEVFLPQLAQVQLVPVSLEQELLFCCDCRRFLMRLCPANPHILAARIESGADLRLL